MRKKIGVWIICLLLTAALTSCGRTNEPKQSGGAGEEQDTIPVTVTFNAMKEFVQAVGGDRVSVTTIIPDGTEPHDFEPKAQDLSRLSESKVFVYNGLGMESWADKAVASVGNGGLITVEASRGADPIPAADEGESGEHGQDDPHLWLSLKGAEIEVGNITEALKQADPAHAEEYQANGDAYRSQLESLYTEYAEKFGSVSNRNFVTGHAAFAYLCRDFGLNQKSVEDVFAEGEPNAKQMAALVDYCKRNGVKTVFSEEEVSPEVSETLASEVGATVKTIYTMESSEGGSYLDRQRENLAEIFESLR